MPYLAKWYDNKAAAISLRFDDASETHVQTVIPILNRYGFKATFMINPGRRSYRMFKDFWEHQVPAMGHRFGNHTWNHKGANSLEEADREIGSVSNLIWKLYPSVSKLNVFASGGGEKWAGGSWEDAPDEYKKLLSKYDLIDLYDGNHRSQSGRSDVEVEDMCESVEKAIHSGSHQAFSFHRIGNFDMYDFARKILGRDIYTFSFEKFERFISCLHDVEASVWIGPLVQVYKYEFEYQNATLDVIEARNDRVKLNLIINSDALLYDQPLTLVVGRAETGLQVFQTINSKIINLTARSSPSGFLIDLAPQNSQITILCSEQ